LVAIIAPSSPERSAAILSYFVLWSMVAPMVHSIAPAAGPIFYEAMGYGSRFAAIEQSAETAAVAGYLWNFYESGSFGAGNGISAMPSMHVATSTWVLIVVYTLYRRWLPLAMLAWLTIFVLSVALGWHYAIDGIAGAFFAVLVYRMIFRLACKRAGMRNAKFELDCTQFRPPALGEQMQSL
ncbi:MAG: phosphatase PAP2 family protein, partial [Qipengyuania sp.]